MMIPEIPEIHLHLKGAAEFVPHVPAALQRCIDSGLCLEQLKEGMEILARGETLVTWRCRAGAHVFTRFAGIPNKKL